ncbi:histidine kinase dimerization/phosphoacceptor domain-containing protein [Nostoc sp. NMS8]|uniref:histidine kinase dimerization/phosphoacceptor domain-containing protein n=1 Tax=Nostoc sp. NMS8 TaxID=2815392 RepID=UPI0025E3AFEF|nr:histidine kinase dimerization/phosphoacceptor domain-containing protein [Nostoc sp. NMS8]MBN3958717.1 histidine kinase [Nostoc sp. NMS8]
MTTILFLTILLLTLLCQFLKMVYHNQQKHQQLILAQKQLQTYALQIDNFSEMQQTNDNLLNLYNALGQSIAALHIQLQVSQKLWQINPTQAQQSLSEAYQMSGTLMREVRQVVKMLGQDYSQ